MELKRLGSKMRDEKGAAIVLVALSMVALISAVALAVDVGMMVTTRTEAQRVSDLSALAGAGILAINPNDSVSAVAEAISFAALNTVRGDLAVVLPVDVDVNLDSSTVTVRMVRTQTRGTPVGTFFARIFGVNTVNITTTATAIAEPIGPDSGVGCLLPIMLPDRWSEDPSTLGSLFPAWPGADDSFDFEGSSVPGSKDLIPDLYDPATTGYDPKVIGDRIEIHRAGGGGGGINPSNYYPWTPFDEEDQLVDGGAGAATYESRFSKCLEGDYFPKDSILTEPGAMVGPTNAGFDYLLGLESFMTWNQSENGGLGCPYNTQTNMCDYVSERIRPMPMFDPREAPTNGRKIVHITTFGAAFISGKEGNAYVGYWLGLLSNLPDLQNPPEEGLEKRLRLIR